MLHDEARELAVEAYEATHNIAEVARAFHISKWTLYHMAERKVATVSVALRLHNCGRKKLLNSDDTAHIRTCIELQPDITLQEIKEKLGLKASVPTIQHAVIALGYTFKKKTLHAREQERPRCSSQTNAMERESRA